MVVNNVNNSVIQFCSRLLVVLNKKWGQSSEDLEPLKTNIVTIQQISTCLTLNKSVQSPTAKNTTEIIKSCFHEIQPQLLGAAVTRSCRWNQSLVSVRLQGRSPNNPSHSDVWCYYSADNKISQQPALLCATISFLTNTACTDFYH